MEEGQKPVQTTPRHTQTKEYQRTVQAKYRTQNSDKIKQKNRERYQRKKAEIEEMKKKLQAYEYTRADC